MFYFVSISSRNLLGIIYYTTYFLNIIFKITAYMCSKNNLRVFILKYLENHLQS